MCVSAGAIPDFLPVEKCKTKNEKEISADSDLNEYILCECDVMCELECVCVFVGCGLDLRNRKTIHVLVLLHFAIYFYIYVSLVRRNNNRQWYNVSSAAM